MSGLMSQFCDLQTYPFNRQLSCNPLWIIHSFANGVSMVLLSQEAHTCRFKAIAIISKPAAPRNSTRQ